MSQRICRHCKHEFNTENAPICLERVDAGNCEPRPRGFAAMDRERAKQIASKGGKAAHAMGRAHQFSSDEARDAGRKGGTAPHVSRGGRRKKPAAPPSPPAE